MSAVPFSELPDHARLWIFGASDPLGDSEAARLLERTDEFVASWLAHGRSVVGGRDWRYDHFLLVAADEEATGVSGCSIDSLFHSLKDVERNLDITLLDSARVFYRDANGEIRAASRAEFRDRMQSAEVNEDTIVFDNTLRTVGDLRGGGWEIPMRASWHARAFAR